MRYLRKDRIGLINRKDIEEIYYFIESKLTEDENE